jgi:outer membrane protein assembly factor BamB
VPTPVALGNRLLVTSENNGTRLYEFDSEGQIRNQPIAVNEELAADVTTPTVVAGRVFGLWSDLFCVDPNQGLRTVWTHAEPSFRVHGTIIGADDRLLVTGASGELLLIDATADPCRIIARLRVFDYGDAELYSHPAIVGQHLFMRGADEIVCLDLAP